MNRFFLMLATAVAVSGFTTPADADEWPIPTDNWMAEIEWLSQPGARSLAKRVCRADAGGNEFCFVVFDSGYDIPNDNCAIVFDFRLSGSRDTSLSSEEGNVRISFADHEIFNRPIAVFDLIDDFGSVAKDRKSVVVGFIQFFKKEKGRDYWLDYADLMAADNMNVSLPLEDGTSLDTELPLHGAKQLLREMLLPCDLPPDWPKAPR